MPAHSPKNSPPGDASSSRPTRVLVLAETHTRCGAILHWISADQRVPVSRLAHPGATDLRHVDVTFEGRACRILGVPLDALRQPVVHEFAAECDRVLIVGSAPAKSGVPAADLAGALIAIPAHFKRAPLVSYLSPRAAPAQSAAALKKLKSAGFATRETNVDAGAFADIWRELCTMTRDANESGKNNAGKDSPTNPETKKGFVMANAVESLNALMQIDGAVGGLIADWQSGMMLAKAGGGVNLEVAAAGNSEVIKSKMKTMQALGLKEGIEDILITLGTQYHVIRPLTQKAGLFLYLVLDKTKANLAMARFKVSDIEKSMTI